MCQAGHPNPFRVSRDGAVESLGCGGFPVGLLPNAHYENIEFKLHPGDRLYCYSDGISECMNAEEQQYSTDRLVNHLLQYCLRPLSETLAGLRVHLQDWRHGEPFEDDVSLIAIEFDAARAA